MCIHEQYQGVERGVEKMDVWYWIGSGLTIVPTHGTCCTLGISSHLRLICRNLLEVPNPTALELQLLPDGLSE